MNAGHRLGLVLLCASVGLACRTETPPLHPPTLPGSWYVVREGETLAEVAKRSGVPLEDVLELNGLSRGDTLPPGKAIFIMDAAALHGPATPTPAPDAGARVAKQAAAAGLTPPPAPKPGMFAWPLAAPRVTSAFGVRGARPHEGIDLGAPEGTPVFAAAAGEVVYAGDGIRGYGNLVVLQHSEGLLTVYAHNTKLLVKVGDRATAGQTIALVGQTGHATAPHLHFEIRDGQIPRDPLRYLPPLP